MLMAYIDVHGGLVVHDGDGLNGGVAAVVLRILRRGTTPETRVCSKIIFYRHINIIGIKTFPEISRHFQNISGIA